MIAAGLGMVAVSARPLGGARFRPVVETAAPILLCAAVLIGWHTRELFNTYRVYPALHRAVEQNFKSGFSKDDSAMVFLLPPDHGLILGAQAEPGTYTRSSTGSDYIQYILRYFGKAQVVVRSSKDSLER